MNQRPLLEPGGHAPDNNHAPLIIAEEGLDDPKIPYLKLFRYANCQDKILITIGSISSIIKGATIPYFLLLVGKIINVYGSTLKPAEKSQSVTEIVEKFYTLGLVNLVASFLMMQCWRKSSERQATLIQRRYLGSWLLQEMTFSESKKSCKDLDEECMDIQMAIGEKLSSLLCNLSMVVFGLIIAFTQGWQLALILTGVSIFFPWMFWKLNNVWKTLYEGKETAEKKANAIAEEILHKVKEVMALGGQEKEKIRYQAALEAGKKDTEKCTMFRGILQGLAPLVNFGFCLLGFYVGSMLITPIESKDKGFSGGEILIVISCCSLAYFSLEKVFLIIKSLEFAKISGAHVFGVIDRPEKIDERGGTQFLRITGHIEFRNVKFGDNILDDVSFRIRPGQKVALVGDWNCGKTACLDLLQRFYEPTEGPIIIDGLYEIQDFSRKLLSRNIGYIGKEPVLLENTIKENLLMVREFATNLHLRDALEKVDTFEYIRNLSLDLEVSKISRGVKYLVNMAQILLKDPMILLIDEPVYNFGKMNEAIQEAFRIISEGRTTIVIARSLETMRSVDRIVVLEKGKIVEEGTYQDLITKQEGKFSALHQLKSGIPSPMNRNEQDPNVEKVFPEKEEKIDRKLIWRYSGQSLRLYYTGLAAIVLKTLTLLYIGYKFCNFLELIFDSNIDNFKVKTNSLSMELLIFIVIYSFLNLTGNFIFNTLGDDASRQIKTKLFDKFLKMPPSWFNQPECAPNLLCDILSKDLSPVRELVLEVFFALLLIGFLVVSFFVMLPFGFFWYSILIPLLGGLGDLRHYFYQEFYPKKSLYEESSSFVGKSVKNIKAVALLIERDITPDKYFAKATKLLEAENLKTTKNAIFYGACCYAFFHIFAYIFLVGARRINSAQEEEDLSMQVIRSLFLVLFFMYAIIHLASNREKKAGISTVLGLLKFLDKPVYGPMYGDYILNARNARIGNINFRDVSLKSSDSERFIFRDLNLEIQAGTKVAFVGLSEEGKSAILMLLQSLERPLIGGSILVNAVNLRDYDLEYLRERIGVISKECVFLDGTIEYNLKYGQEDLTDQEMRIAAERAGALNFIVNNNFELMNPNDEDNNGQGLGFQRVIGSKGGQLCKSQARRIAIARGIRKDPSMLIVDDITNGLDVENERSIQESLDRIMEGKTCFILSERIETLKKVDEVFVFREDRLVERGSYEILNGQQGLFSQLQRELTLDI